MNMNLRLQLVGVKSDDAETGMHKNDEGGDGKEDSFDESEGTEVAQIHRKMVAFLSIHEQRAPILCVLFKMLTTFPTY